MSEHTSSPLARAVGIVSVLGVLVGALGAVASLAVTNDLLTASSWATPALVVFVVVVGTLALLVFAGRPSRRWLRTPYW